MSREQSKKKKRDRRPSIAVQCPNPTSAPSITRSNNRVRSDGAWMDKDDKKNIIRFQRYLDYAPTIVVPVTLRGLTKPLTAGNKKKLEENAERLAAPSHPVRCTSAKYIDRNGEPLLYYFGRRLVRPEDKKGVKFRAKDQYSGQSVEEIERAVNEDKSTRLVRDGLSDIKCENYQLAAQSLCMDTKLHLLFDDARHEGKNVMDYETPWLGTDLDTDASLSDMSVSEGEDGDDGDHGRYEADASSRNVSDKGYENEDDGAMEEDDDPDLEEDCDQESEDDGDQAPEDDIEYTEVDGDEINMEAYDTENTRGTGVQKTEQAGVIHLVHGWTQRGHPNDGLYISGDMTTSSTTVAGCGSHYSLTESVARTIALAFRTVFPDWYETYQEAFKAGVWFADDPGPFLGRAIVYKLQGRLHKDRHDVGPSVSFPVGQFTGGEMVFPQLNTKLQYSPGDFCIFFSSTIYHKVAPFTPLPQTPEQVAQNITPGRIGSVFFFPRNSLRTLKGKPDRWGYRTAFGKNEHLYYRRKRVAA